MTEGRAADVGVPSAEAAPGQARDLRLRGLSWRPQGREEPTLDGLDLTIPAGQRVLLAGPSGAGKSTVLRALAGLLDPEAGDIDGQQPIPERPGERGLLLQNPVHAIVAATVGRDTAFGPENAALPADEIQERVTAALDAARVDVDASRDPMRTSGGQQQRIALAGALALHPGALLLDEPTSMLDPDTADRVREAILAATADRTLVLAEHRIEPWLDHLDRIILLGPGATILADGPPTAVLAAHPALREAEPRPGPVPEATLRRAPGALTVITGPSGAGKTTLLRTLADEPRGARPGYVPQNPEHAFVATTVRGELMVPLREDRDGDTATWRERAARAEELLAAADLSHLAEANPHRLSGGEQRRVAILGALAPRPEVLLLDEPTVGLDRERREAVLALLDAAREEGCTVLAATHDPHLIARADHRHELGAEVGRASHDRADAPASQAAAGPARRPDRTIGPVPRSGRPVAADRLNPLTLCLIGLLAAAGSFAVQSWQVGLLSLIPLVLLAPLAVRTLRGGLLRLAPILFSALTLAWTTALLGTAPPLSGEAWLLGLKEACRITVFVAPGVLALGSVDVTALGDSLGARLRLPARPVAASVSALVRTGHLGQRWGEITRVRRLRGLGGSRSLRAVAGSTLALLVDALRGAEQQALAMDARGFARATRRTWTGVPPFRAADAVGLALGVALGLLPLVLTLAL